MDRNSNSMLLEKLITSLEAMRSLSIRLRGQNGVKYSVYFITATQSCLIESYFIRLLLERESHSMLSANRQHLNLEYSSSVSKAPLLLRKQSTSKVRRMKWNKIWQRKMRLLQLHS